MKHLFQKHSVESATCDSIYISYRIKYKPLTIKTDLACFGGVSKIPLPCTQLPFHDVTRKGQKHTHLSRGKGTDAR